MFTSLFYSELAFLLDAIPWSSFCHLSLVFHKRIGKNHIFVWAVIILLFHILSLFLFGMVKIVLHFRHCFHFVEFISFTVVLWLPEQRIPLVWCGPELFRTVPWTVFSHMCIRSPSESTRLLQTHVNRCFRFHCWHLLKSYWIYKWSQFWGFLPSLVT